MRRVAAGFVITERETTTTTVCRPWCRWTIAKSPWLSCCPKLPARRGLLEERESGDKCERGDTRWRSAREQRTTRAVVSNDLLYACFLCFDRGERPDGTTRARVSRRDLSGTSAASENGRHHNKQKRKYAIDLSVCLSLSRSRERVFGFRSSSILVPSRNSFDERRSLVEETNFDIDWFLGYGYNAAAKAKRTMVMLAISDDLLFSITRESLSLRLAWGRYIYTRCGTLLTLIVVTVMSLPRSRMIANAIIVSRCATRWCKGAASGITNTLNGYLNIDMLWGDFNALALCLFGR